MNDTPDCGGAGCGTDPERACLRCCRIMLANYAANHGDRCDAEQERLLATLERCEERLARLAIQASDLAIQASDLAALARKLGVGR